MTASGHEQREKRQGKERDPEKQCYMLKQPMVDCLLKPKGGREQPKEKHEMERPWMRRWVRPFERRF